MNTEEYLNISVGVSVWLLLLVSEVYNS